MNSSAATDDQLAHKQRLFRGLRRAVVKIGSSILSRGAGINRERLRSLAPGLTARSALEKFAAMQMIDVHLPTTDGRELILTRTTQPEPELQLLLGKLKLELPAQPPPKITTAQAASATAL